MPATETGVTFTNALSPMDAARNQIRLNGSGVATGDVDGDGRVDLFFAALQGGGRLYRNLGGWRFEDVTDAAGVALPGRASTGAAFADVDGDGDLDLLVNALGGGTVLLVNDGKGRFHSDPDSGLISRHGATSLTLADIDGDGDLDLYVANYRTNTIRSEGFAVLNVNGRRMVRPEDRDRLEYLPDGRILEHGEPDILYLNDGRGHFTPESWTEGRFLDVDGKPLPRAPHDWSLSAAFRDLNDDGAPDLYVCGDFHSPDRLWLNDGHGRFRAARPEVLRNSPTFSMAVDFADFDRDGHVDFFVADMRDRRHEFRVAQSIGAMSMPGDFEALLARPQLARNVLQWNRGDGTFSEIAGFAGVEASGWTWSIAFLDVDLDGYEDLLGATGHAFDTQDLDAQEKIDANGPYRMDQIPAKLLQYPPLLSRKVAFRNRGDRRFEEIGAAWGWAGEPGVWQGMCLADLDGDGDLDVVVNRLNGPAGLYRNEASAPRVLVRLNGLPPNTRGIGARLELRGGAVPSQIQEMSAGGRYLSGDDPARVFATGAATNDLRLEVRWPSGRRSVVTGFSSPATVTVNEREAGPPVIPVPPVSAEPTLFVDDSARIGYRHHETPFDDFAVQPLLPKRLSRDGPGVGWIDVDGDGREDLVIAGGRGGRPGLFLNAGQGRLQLVEAGPARRDQIGVASGATAPGRVDALVASSATEEGPEGMSSLLAIDSAGASREVLPLGAGAIGPLALADLDGDGDLDLFVGGTAVVGRYPAATPSRLFRRDGDRWVADESAQRVLSGVGIVRGAIWSDLDGDGFPELVLACEWGPIRVFRNRAGSLVEVTKALGFEAWTGWWTGVQAGDFDGDGRLDLVVGNWGQNSTWHPDPEHPLRLYHGDIAGRGETDLVLASFDVEQGQWVPERDLTDMSRQFPWLRGRFAGHHAYARAGVDAVLATAPGAARVLEANTFASAVFLNRGDHFERLPLPAEAQLAPVQGIGVADFDLDGRLDLFLAQNFFAVSPAVSRQDAGRGQLLLGSGDGRFRAVDGARSGIAVYGEQRGVACADYDGDGRPDFAVAQNDAETRLFRNASRRAGLRLRLRGSAGNPQGFGAVLRVRDSAGPGPACELHAGGGYASQDAPEIWVPRPTGPVTVEVRWPGGRMTRHPLPADPVRVGAILDASSASSP